MKFDSYSRFLKSSLYQECLRAEMDGLPLPDPYQIPCSPAPSKHSASSDRSTVSTPKKVPLRHLDCIQPTITSDLSTFGCPRSYLINSFVYLQEVRKQRSGRSPNEDNKDESADKKRGIFFSWSRNRSFGKGPKKKDIGDINLGESIVVTFFLPIYKSLCYKHSYCSTLLDTLNTTQGMYKPLPDSDLIITHWYTLVVTIQHVFVCFMPV